MLTVEVIEVGVHGLGFTALWPGIGIFPDWVRRKEFGLQNRNVRVEQGIVPLTGLYAGMDATEIAFALDTLPATVRSRLRRALQLLRERLGADADTLQDDTIHAEGDSYV
jgi:hypothetical protein